ncbi:hypothetical protein CC80DRAFT_554053 [Byssothecium circinans]|uniref:Fucose-specific lectin n=1 Tax=Byssothecium circinans TaxID=147558 RepID=A0A6A5TGC1_9PLEO|nr:hypothetical protein CC80DRAFT_554053 [Byssothecium circinans]
MAEHSPRSPRSVGREETASPMSFFVSSLHTIDETEVRSLNPSRRSLDAENSSTRSTGYLTALPTWESLRNGNRPRLHIPLPTIPKRVHIRKEGQTPVQEKERIAKEMGVIHRSDSRKLEDRFGASIPDDVEEQEEARYRRLLVWCISTVIAVLIVAIVLGAVLGTIGNVKHSTGPRPSVTEIPAGSTPAPTTPTGEGTDAIPPGATPHIASVSVAGWDVSGLNGYHEVWLFWQNSQGYLSRAAFNSSTGIWTRVSNFTKAKKGTPLAATALNAEWYEGQENYTFTDTKYQTSVTYLDDKNFLNEWIFPDDGPEIGLPGPLSQQKYIAHEDTKIASYWPHIVYQGVTGELRNVYYGCHEKDHCWHERVFRTTQASNGTQLILVPLGNNLASLGIFYQEDGGRFLEYRENYGAVGSLWENSAFSRHIPPNASVAAFSTTRTNDAQDPNLNTYLLWQGSNNTIQMSYSDSGDGWKRPITYPAFAAAENGTALACLTGMTFLEAPLQSGTELARCYFQTGRALREVSFDGDSWNVVGVVPIDS